MTPQSKIVITKANNKLVKINDGFAVNIFAFSATLAESTFK